MKKLLIIVLCLAICAVGLEAQGPTGRAVTQATSITTPVTINTEIGVITTVSATNAQQTLSSFVVNNSAVSATSTVSADVQGYSGTLGTNGFPTVVVTGVGAGVFTINLCNVHGANPLNGTVQIGFIVR